MSAPHTTNDMLPIEKGTLALIVLDMQEYFRKVGSSIISNVANVVHECNNNGVPVFLTQHGHKDIHKDGGSLKRWWGAGKGDFVQYDSEDWDGIYKDSCAPKSFREKREDNNHYLENNGTFLVDDKSRYDAFEGTQLHRYLQERGIKTVAIAGVMTNLCCETTARRAFVLDYDVLFLEDGTATANDKLHQATLLNMSFGFARLMSCNKFTNLVRTLK